MSVLFSSILCIIRSQVLLSNKTNRYFYDLNVLWVTLNENFCEWNETVLSVCLEQTQSFSSEKFLLLLFRCWVTDWTANTGNISLTNSNPIHDPIKHWNTLRISHNCWLSVVHYEATKGTPCWKWQIQGRVGRKITGGVLLSRPKYVVQVYYDCIRQTGCVL